MRSVSPPSVSPQHMLLLEQALTALHHITDLKMEVDYNSSPLVLRVSMNKKVYTYQALFKTIDRRSIVAQLSNLQDKSSPLQIVVTRKITPEMAQECRNLNVQFIDANGNAYLKAPEWMVCIEGRKESASQAVDRLLKPVSSGLVSASALRIVFALLTQQEFVQKSFRDIAKITGVSLGTVSAVFDDLMQRGFVKNSKKVGRQLLNRQGLQNEWIVNYDTRLRPRLLLGRYRSENPDWWRNIDPGRYHGVWGGEVAADQLTAYLRPVASTIYVTTDAVKANMAKLVKEHRLLRDPQGNIEILEAFWPVEGKTVCPPLLVYVDLLNSLDPRNLEAAELIKKKYL